MRFQRFRSSERATDSESGSEVVSHVLLQVLVVTIFLGLMQLGIALHVRNVATHAAVEGARRGALLGGNESEAAIRVEQIMDSVLVSAPKSIGAHTEVLGGREIFVVNVRTAIPVLGPWGPSLLNVQGRALVEGDTDG